MTLNLMAVTSRGVWQSSDNRIVQLPSGRVLVDDSMKFVAIGCPNGFFLLTYTGAGLLRDLPLSDWIRRFAAGPPRTIAETIELIRDRANEDLARPACRAGVHHSFVLGGFEVGAPWTGVITNIERRPDWRSYPPQHTFEVGAIGLHHGEKIGISDPYISVTGGGAEAVSPADRNLIEKLAHANPRPAEFRRVLAAVNRRTSAARHPAAAYVSPHCVTAYLSPSGAVETNMFEWPRQLGKPLEIPVPVIRDGIDMTDFAGMFDSIVSSFAMKDGSPIPVDEVARVRQEAIEQFETATGAPAVLRPKKPRR
jgi:hypothetical protein